MSPKIIRIAPDLFQFSVEVWLYEVNNVSSVGRLNQGPDMVRHEVSK